MRMKNCKENRDNTVKAYLEGATTGVSEGVGNWITINNVPVTIKEYNSQRVVTFKDIDTIHERPEGTARKRFNNNKMRFIEGEDYFKIQPSEIRTVGIASPNGGIVVTESGYLMIVKSFTDDLVWQVQRGLVNGYFRARDMFAVMQAMYNEMVVMKQDINSLKNKKPMIPNFWLWKKHIARPAIEELADTYNI